jgi:uncharacterized protein (TIGR03437 family)
LRYTIAFLLFSLSAVAQPQINSNYGVTSAASPFIGLAPGCIFFVNGVNLGAANDNPMSLFQNATYPLPTSAGLNGTTIQFVPIGGQGPAVANQGAVNGIMLYESPTLLAAILPSSTQVADYNVTVTYNGQTSAPSPLLRVAPRNFGLFTYAQLQGGPGLGYGPGALLELNSSNTYVYGNLGNTATPGGTVVLMGTGLGATQGNDSQGPATSGIVGLSPVDFQVYIGGQLATFAVGQDYIGRFIFSNGPVFAGIDIIQVQVPKNVQGCAVPVTVILDGVASNFTTMSIDPSGSYCSEPVIGYTLSDFQQIHADQMARVGTVGIVGSVLNGYAPDGTPITTRTDSVTTSFVNLTAAQLDSTAGYPSVGGCSVIPVSLSEAPSPQALSGAPLDAGATLNLNGPNGYQPIAQALNALTYPAISSSTPLVDAGSYSIDNGGGGADVGSFQGLLNVPAPPQIVSAGVNGVINTTQNLSVQWSGADPNSEILIFGASIDLNTSYSVVFECTAPSTATQFTVPSYVLSSLPTTSTSVGVFSLQNIGQQSFQAPGLEAGHFTYQIGPSVQVQFTRGAPVKQ